jgi:hypothetical protein
MKGRKLGEERENCKQQKFEGGEKRVNGRKYGEKRRQGWEVE